MQVKVKKALKMTGKLGVAGALLLASGLTSDLAMARVVGTCDNCHTMHNSQSNAVQVVVRETNTGTAAGWNNVAVGPATTITGGAAPSTAGQGELLKYDCVSCHSNTGTATIVTGALGGNRIPIVYNTNQYPAGANGATNHELAGGNFYRVAGNSAYGHNVRGISGSDVLLSNAPGDSETTCGISCHDNLTLTATATTPPYGGAPAAYSENGCQGCHLRVGHHNGGDTSYRYLGGHGAPGMGVLPANADNGAGLPDEDPDWEQTASSAKHNTYNASPGTAAGSNNKTTMGAFCGGCHGNFHAQGTLAYTGSAQNNGGDLNDGTDGPSALGNPTATSVPMNPWMRHPTSVRIPMAPGSEYAALNGAPYNPVIPVAQLAGGGGDPDTVDYGDQVFCLSCHRAHGSQYPDALRFDYTGMIAHKPNVATDGTGCFYCHTTKDNP